ncbi:MAG: ATP-binding cassette domain-containing protein [Planctomycetes bacterium]|nr:ATP-binding cassette domain-containing protein [Planctomycetota bacterium]
MKAFNRIFKYLWPQWHRVVLTLSCALIVAILLSVSYATAIPLLKVIIVEAEGLHTWIEREACSVRYGIGFYKKRPAIAKLRQNSLAERADLQAEDLIVGFSSPAEPNLYADILEVLANPKTDTLTLKVKRGGANATETRDIDIATRPETLSREGLSLRERFSLGLYGVRLSLVDSIQRAISGLPREKTPDDIMRTVTFIVVLMLICTFVRCIAKFFQASIAQKIVLVAITRLRYDLFEHITHMPVGYFTRERPSDTISRTLRDTAEMSQALKVMLGKAIREPLNALIALTFAMIIHWQLTAIFMLGGPFILILVGQFGRIMKRATRKSLVAGAQMLAKLEETIGGLRVVKVFNQQAYEQAHFKQINKRLLKQQLEISRVEAATSPVLEILGMAGGCVAIYVGVLIMQNPRAGIDGEEFLGLLVLLGASAEALRKASDVWNKIQRASAAAERVFELLDQPVETQAPNAKTLPPFKSKIEFKDIVFTYPGNSELTLRGITLTIHAGENIAIVGPNGCGKTTLACLLPRFYDPDSGQINIDGQDIRDVTLESLRSQIGMVTQNVISFNDTVANNIAYGKTDASSEAVVQAAKQAFAHEFIQTLPQGYDTIVGEGGSGLSGGQLQRIVIARAILKNPRILIFDEATSQVDADSESKIHKAIQEIMAHRTTLIIAHRFSTVVAADQIVVVNKGQIVAKGTHNELMLDCSLYQGLYETQLVK